QIFAPDNKRRLYAFFVTRNQVECHIKASPILPVLLNSLHELLFCVNYLCIFHCINTIQIVVNVCPIEIQFN
ncbi:MAG: hypothetical protein NUV31_10130, partial [Dehalococcoidales bacterium]|nr:hypothetical protein [Dehalococcoidales bacterium]